MCGISNLGQLATSSNTSSSTGATHGLLFQRLTRLPAWLLPAPLQEKAFPAGCETRFGILVMQGEVVMANQDALVATVSDQLRWDAASSGSVNAAKMHKLCVGHGGKFWARLRLVLRLCRPVMDAIHQFEANKPLVSQVYPVWDAIEAHVAQWVEVCKGLKEHRDYFREDKVRGSVYILALKTCGSRQSQRLPHILQSSSSRSS